MNTVMNNIIPTLLIGPPGVGKTASVRAEYDYVETVLLSACTEEDIAGLPYHENGIEKRTTPPFIERLRKATGTKVLFLDELDKARRAVADTLLSLVQNPEIFGLPKDVDIVAAANPPEWGGGDGISQAMLSRFASIQYVPDPLVWQRIMLEKFADAPQVKRLTESVILGEIPMMESTGEGLGFRLTCPRTLDRAVEVLLAPSLSPERKRLMVAGLLTSNAASGVISCFEECGGIQGLARKIGAKAKHTLPDRPASSAAGARPIPRF